MFFVRLLRESRFPGAGLNVLDRDTLVTRHGTERPPYVIPGQAARSPLWHLIGDRGHPGLDRVDQLSPGDKALLRRWIDRGAEFPPTDRRPFRTERDILSSIRDHLQKTPAADRRHQRYFTFANLNNHPEVTAADLRLCRSALAKLVNSLSWEPAIVVPKVVDSDAIVLCIDLRSLGWVKDGLWREILKFCPYGLTHGSARDPLHEIGEEVQALAGEDIPHVRADWFVAMASRPPLYPTLLRLPDRARALEAKLGVDVQSDFLCGTLARAGFAKSGVSTQNQVAERHDISGRGYWKTYDFGPKQAGGDLFRFPLGPDFEGHPFPSQAFVPAGSALLVPLPNGLQAYMLVDRAGARIDAAPAEIACDPLRTAGTSALVARLSCLACHKGGVFPLQDEVRHGCEATGPARVKVEALYPERAELEALRAKDQRRFSGAAREAMSPFLRTDAGTTEDVRDVPEPISALARWYAKDLGLEAVASELGIEDVTTFRAKIQGNAQLRKLGLEPLLLGNAIRRDDWHNAFDLIAVELDVGTPHRAF